MAAAALTGAACVGNIGSERSSGGGGSAGTSSGGAVAPAPVSGPASVLSFPNGPAPVAHLRRLTTPEFAYSVQDLLGGSGVPVSSVDPDLSIGVFGPSPVNLGGFAKIGASTISTSPSGVGLYEASVRGATAAAFADPTKLSFLACVPTSTTDPCLTQAIHAFGRRAFRRPLTSAETMTLVTLATTIGNQSGSSVLTGLQNAIDAILQWPDFLYRVELGVQSAADGGRLKYTSYEIASRLAAMLWSSVPDDTLLDAASMDALSTPDGITTQAQRMIADPRVHRALAAFTDELFALQGMSTTTKDATLFPAWTATMGPAMQQELELRVDDMVYTQQGDFLSLFQSTSTFVNSELAQFYGLPAPSGSGFQPATFRAGSPRVGILGSGAILATQALSDRTSPVKRGLLVDQMLRCMVISAPPPGVPPLPPTQNTNETVRQELDAHVASKQCSGCHSLLDPIGFGMENFDAIGQYRTTEKGQTVDASGTLNGIAFHDLAGLETAIQKDPAAAPCLVSNFYVNAVGRAAIGFDEPSINTLTTQFATAGNRVDQLLVSMVSSDSFRFVVPK
jgi:hypothetical protein